MRIRLDGRYLMRRNAFGWTTFSLATASPCPLAPRSLRIFHLTATSLSWYYTQCFAAIPSSLRRPASHVRPFKSFIHKSLRKIPRSTLPHVIALNSFLFMRLRTPYITTEGVHTSSFRPFSRFDFPFSEFARFSRFVPFRPKSPGMNTSIKCACNPSRMNTSKIIGLKVLWNEHLRKKVGGGVTSFKPKSLPPLVRASSKGDRLRRRWHRLFTPRIREGQSVPRLSLPQGTVHGELTTALLKVSHLARKSQSAGRGRCASPPGRPELLGSSSPRPTPWRCRHAFRRESPC